MAENTLHPDHGLRIAAPGVADESAPLARLQYVPEHRNFGKSPSVQSDLAHNRIALRDLPQVAARGFDLSDERREPYGGEKIRANQKTVPLERFAVLHGDQVSELAATSTRQPMGESDASGMETPFVQTTTPDYEIAFE
jgi:hypothetical protein